MADGIALSAFEWTLAWNVRGDSARTDFRAEVERLFDVALPVEANTTAQRGGVTVFWLGPRSWLITATRAQRVDFDAARVALNAVDGALFDVSVAYVGWRFSGADVARLLNRSCPLDLDARAFTAGRCAQSVLGHINALIHRPGDAAEFVVVVARSYAVDARHELVASMEAER